MVCLFLLRQSVLLMLCLVNQIALSVPPSFQPLLIIFVRLNRLKAPLGRTVLGFHIFPTTLGATLEKYCLDTNAGKTAHVSFSLVCFLFCGL
jgi:hypothetical protein